MEIRKANLEDWKKLNILFSELDFLHIDSLPEVFCKPDGPARPLQYFQKVFADPNSIIFIAETENEVIGLIHVYVRESQKIPLLVSRKFAVVEDLVVKSTFQGKGIGVKLMKAAESWIREKGADLVELNVWEFNKRAKNFYENLGYETISRKMWKRLHR